MSRAAPTRAVRWRSLGRTASPLPGGRRRAMFRDMLRAARTLGRDVHAFGGLALRRARLLPSDSRRDILFVDHLVPDPALGAGYPRAFELARCLVEDGWRVTMYPLEGDRHQSARVAALLPRVRFLRPLGVPGLRRLVRTRAFAAIIVSRPTPMAAFLVAAADKVNVLPLIYDAEALLASRDAVRQHLLGVPLDRNEHERAVAAEIALARSARAIMAVTPAEARQFGDRLGVPVVVASHCLPVPASTTAFDERQDLLFVGRMTGTSAASPNVDSVVWFVREVMPLLDRTIGPAYRVHLVGLLDSSEITPLLSLRVIAHGTVDDLGTWFDRARVFIAPTRFSAGLPLKVVEAMTRGIPCATTPLLKQQLGQEQGSDPADPSPTDFAEEVRRLYEERDTWQDARAAGLRQVAAQFSPAAFAAAIREALATVGAVRP